ncbi:hypothetical protein T4E_6319 [Trichinella pseudospiralis]|uniref:Uncharacterized protein n=1 Tax=Trichinella pseudospiralis TaxID=6337 RepID=A0A0V0XSE6_TRIPS|nr:hypothetical protein T4E_6319 [Trichinella pseudospiralis]
MTKTLRELADKLQRVDKTGGGMRLDTGDRGGGLVGVEGEKNEENLHFAFFKLNSLIAAMHGNCREIAVPGEDFN